MTSDNPRYNAAMRAARGQLWGGGLILLTLATFSPALSAGFIWDDPDYIINNATLRSRAGLWNIWLTPRATPQYYPLVHSTFWLEYQAWGLWAAGYHLVNILLHAASAVLLWRVLIKLGLGWAAWLAAAIWAAHPMQAESVAWVTERKNILSGLLYLGVAVCYLRFDDRRKWGGYTAAMVLFAGALLSKTVTCSLPAALLLALWWKKGRLAWRDVWPLVPMFIVGAVMALVTAHLERSHVGASGWEWDHDFTERLRIASTAIWFYAGKFIAPINLSFVYPKWTITASSWALVAAALLAIAVAWRIGRGVLVATLFFGGTLLPALGFVNIYPMRYTFAADHYAYLALIGPAVLAGAVLARWRAAAVVVLVLLVGLTFARARIFHDPLTLWTDTVEKNPRSWMVRINLAQALVKAGREADAEKQFKAALDLAPELPETHWNVGVNYAARGEYDKALAAYDEALKRDPAFAFAWYGRGNVFLARGDLPAAEAAFRKAIECFPTYAQAHNNLGDVLELRGDLDGAIAEYRKAVEAEPDFARAHNALGKALTRKRDFAGALSHYYAAVRADPDFAEAHLNLGALLAAMGRKEEARRFIDRAVRLDPKLAMWAEQALPSR